MVITFPCSICVKAIGDKEDSIYCDKCNLWVHIKCKNLNYIDYKYLSGNGDPWFCLKCNSHLFQFGTLDNKKFMHHIVNSSNMKNDNKIEFNNLVLKPPAGLSSLFNQFNNMLQTHDHKDPENVVRCKYYDLEEVQSMKIPNKNSCLSLFHINTCSLNKHFEDLEYLIKSTDINFDIIAISETRILKDTNIAKNIYIPNFSVEFTPTESSAGGTLLYIADHLAYQNRNDLNLHKTNNLESTFIEITNPNKLISLSDAFTDIQKWIFLNLYITILTHY